MQASFSDSSLSHRAYHVQVNATGITTVTDVGLVFNSTFLDLLPGYTYTCRVAAKVGGYWSGYSAATSVITSSDVPETPAAPTIVASTDRFSRKLIVRVTGASRQPIADVLAERAALTRFAMRSSHQQRCPTEQATGYWGFRLC